MLPPDTEAVAEQVFTALADPSRRAILAALASGGLRLVEVRTDRAEGAKLRAAIGQACAVAISALIRAQVTEPPAD